MNRTHAQGTTEGQVGSIVSPQEGVHVKFGASVHLEVAQSTVPQSASNVGHEQVSSPPCVDPVQPEFCVQTMLTSRPTTAPSTTRFSFTVVNDSTTSSSSRSFMLLTSLPYIDVITSRNSRGRCNPLHKPTATPAYARLPFLSRFFCRTQVFESRV